MRQQERFTPIDGEELYKRMSLGRGAVLLDVRETNEYQERHIPGSILIPLQELEQRIEEVPNSGTPITVICEHGLRSRSACTLLAEHGLGPLFNLNGGIQNWPGPVNAGLETGSARQHGITPSSFLIKHFDKLPRGLALDVAMGAGRNAIYLATRGFDVDGVDADPQAVSEARAAARKLGAPIRAMIGNFEDGTYIIPIDTYDLITVFNFLHRPLFNDIKQGVKPGGVVVYQTFTVEQARYGRPKNPDFLLKSGELNEVFSGWDILSSRELVGPSRTDDQMRAIASIVARKPLA